MALGGVGATGVAGIVTVACTGSVGASVTLATSGRATGGGVHPCSIRNCSIVSVILKGFVGIGSVFPNSQEIKVMEFF